MSENKNKEDKNSKNEENISLSLSEIKESLDKSNVDLGSNITNIKSEIKQIESYCNKIKLKIGIESTKKGDNIIGYIREIEVSKNNIKNIIEGKTINHKNIGVTCLLILFFGLPFISALILNQLGALDNEIKGFILFPFFIVIIGFILNTYASIEYTNNTRDKIITLLAGILYIFLLSIYVYILK